MRRDFLHLSTQLQSRPITDDELMFLQRHAERVKQTPALALALKQKEHEIVHATVEKLYTKYPRVVAAL